MAKYRPVDVRLWNDRKFLSLSQEGRMLWLFLLTAPCTLPIPGVLVAGEHALAEHLGWSHERLLERFDELAKAKLSVRRCGRLVWLRNALRYQPPANPNVVKGWAKTWDDVPECDLKHDIWLALRDACKSWNLLFAELFADPSDDGSSNGLRNRFDNGTADRSTQEQEQALSDLASPSVPDQAGPELPDPAAWSGADLEAPPPDEPPPDMPLELPTGWSPAPEPEVEAEALSLGVDLADELRKLHDRAKARGERRLDWQAVWREWLGHAVRFSRKHGGRKPPRSANSDAAREREREQDARYMRDLDAKAAKAQAEREAVEQMARESGFVTNPRKTG